MEQTLQVAGTSPALEWLKDVWRALAEAQRRRAQAQVVGELDPGTLRDIGLGGLANEQKRHSMLHSNLHRLGIR